MAMSSVALPVRILLIAAVAIFDVYAVRAYYAQNDRLPFHLTPAIEQQIAKYLPPLPTSIPTPIPLWQNIEFSQSQWIGNIVYGKLTNHGADTVITPTLRFSLSNSRDDLDVIKVYTATISATIASGESIYFSQRFTGVPTSEFWWNADVIDAIRFTDQTVPKVPTGQAVSLKPIKVPVTQSTSVTTDKTPWGVAKQIDEVTWTIKVGQDDRMATPQETLQALNSYRQTHGAGALTWDDNLATFANERAKFLNSIRSTDAHKGFKDYIASEDNVRKLGFWSLGENSGYGNKLIGVHLIEWIYASDEGHNKNQLDPHWSHVGIGISGLGVAFIFGGDKI